MTFITLEWATDTNYPAGADAWSGTPTRVVPSAGTKTHGFTPEAPASAQELNWLVGRAADAVNFLAGAAQLYDYSAADVVTDTLNVGPGVTGDSAVLLTPSIATVVGDVIEFTITGELQITNSNPALVCEISTQLQENQNASGWSVVGLERTVRTKYYEYATYQNTYTFTVAAAGTFQVRLGYTTVGDAGSSFVLKNTTSTMKVFRKLT